MILYDGDSPTITLTRRQADMVLACLGRAIAEGAYKGCVVPDIGEKVSRMLQAKVDAI